jgi:acyl-CoA synthetase (AMP-forming)/AMP-acid ligase II/short-subunit dehydrogenase
VAGQVVLVTGASSGVGAATARRLGAAGADVLLVARREDQLEQVRAEIITHGGRAFTYPCDLADAQQVDELVARVLEQHGHVDVIVSNAGLSIRRWISESYQRIRDVERTINVNYVGPVRLLLGFLPSMRARGSGHIVNVATMGVNFPPLRWSAYIASKSAFEVWLAGVSPEIRADGVTTTSIQLQLVRSPMLGPFRMWNYIPGMSSDEAASIVARAIVQRPRTISPGWARAAGILTRVAQAPLEVALARYSARANIASRTSEPSLLGALSTVFALRVVQPVRPDRGFRALRSLARYGPTPAAVAGVAAELYPDRTAVIDELGTVSFAELDRDVRALAAAWHRKFELSAEERVALMCRNHRGFLHAAVAATRLGCDLVPLNTDFAGPQLGDVLAREGVSAIVYDEEFADIVDESGFSGTRVVAWHEQPQDVPTVEELIAEGAGGDPPAPASHARIIMLTSGTTGTPKGATRSLKARALAPLAFSGFLDLAKLNPAPRAGEPFLVAPPLFHLYGMVGTLVAFAIGSPVVIRRGFDAEATLEQIDRNRAGVLLAVPTMLSRIMDLPQATRERYDSSSLRMIFSGAAPLAPELATAVMNEFGDVLYNAYATTEVGAGTLATPRDLRAAPGTVGTPMAGVTMRILDEDGSQLDVGETGRIFVGSALLFDGYTGGGSKQVIDGMMSTGDVGHFDARGRLYIDGRDDDMILSGGENVFPQEVEDLLGAHPDVADAAVFGVPDPDFGQRLAAQVVPKEGANPDAGELKRYVRERLARHKVPREVEFVPELPRTSTGKLQRRRLQTQRA